MHKVTTSRPNGAVFQEIQLKKTKKKNQQPTIAEEQIITA
jgi:hypothetical protein